MNIPTLHDAGNVEGKRVLLRLDLNVPIENGEIRDTFRIKAILPTLKYLVDAGARVIILSHLGKGKPEDTLKPVSLYLRDFFAIKFLPLRDSDTKQYIEKMQNGDVILLENLRHTKGEEEDNEDFAKYLASLGEIFVNDAFAVSHRPHASVHTLAKLLPSYMGLLFEKEVANLSRAFSPERPFLFILGGAKISTKIPLLKKFVEIADHVVVGGASANNFYKAKGYEVGKSVIDEDALSGLDDYIQNEKVIIPEEIVVKPSRSPKPANCVSGDEIIADIGVGSIQKLEPVIMEAKLIVWNGPLGWYEEGFTDGSKSLLEIIARSNAVTILGGGDTVALVNAMGYGDKFSFISTGGGAMLDFLSAGTLPGIEALQKNS